MIRIFKALLAGLWYRLTSPPYRLLRNSELFDPVYYREHNQDVAALGMDPLAHYLTRGFAERRSPGPFFDRRYYLHQVPELDETRENPLVHFLSRGRRHNLRPNHLVDPTYYARRTPGFSSSGLDPLAHFLRQGKNGQPVHSPSPYFDPDFYCRTYPDAAGLAHDPVAAYRHFFLIGQAGHRQPSAFFDTAWYLDRAHILREQGLDPLSHYHLFGIEEKKSPSPLFDPAYYEKTCPGAAGETDPFAHYLREEPAGDQRPCAWFDPRFYREKYLGAENENSSPLKHYLQQGVRDKAYPNGEVAALAMKPLISVVVPVYNVLPAYLNNCIRSVLYQSYPHWELCLADDCSTDPAIRPLLERWAGVDSRIKIAFQPTNGGISAATNAAAALATGQYLAFLDNDDELAPEALFAFAAAMGSCGGDLFYSDEDLIGADSTRFSVFRKPGYNRELLFCHNYVTHCVVAARALFDRVGGCDSTKDGAQDHDLFLKLAEKAERVTHLPEILYHWRASESSTSINHSQKDYAEEAGRRSVAAALTRQGIAGAVECTELKYFYRPRRLSREQPAVTILVPWHRPIDQLRDWLARFTATAGRAIDQVIVGVESAAWLATLDRVGEDAAVDIRGLTVAGDAGPAVFYHNAMNHISGEFTVLADCRVHTPGDNWLAALLEYGLEEGTGLIGGRVDSPEAPEVTPIPDCSQASASYYARFLATCSTLMNGLHCPQEVRSITGELCLIRTSLLRAADGFAAAEFPRLFFAQDLAFRLRQQGRANIYTPYCTSTLTVPDNPGPQPLVLEKMRFQERWFDLLNQGDPFYNTGLLVDRQLSVAAFQAWLTGSPASPLDIT